MNVLSMLLKAILGRNNVHAEQLVVTWYCFCFFANFQGFWGVGGFEVFLVVEIITQIFFFLPRFIFLKQFFF